MFSLICSNSTLPPNSETITALYGSQSQITSPFLTLAPGLIYKLEPYGMLPVVNTIPVLASVIRTSVLRPITMLVF
jgi:hypothetical protein